MDGNEQKPVYRLVVLAGGSSAERAISVESGRAVTKALRRRGHVVRQVDPREIAVEAVHWDDVDACVIALHGGEGEDGQIQARLDRLGVRYTGSGAQASRLAMSKSASKERFRQREVPTPAYVLFETSEPVGAVWERAQGLRGPWVVKPDCEGSSLGVTIARTERAVVEGVARCHGYGEYGIVEEYVAGREMTVAVMGRRALPTVEILPEADSFFDYESKYESTATQYRVGDEICAALDERLRGVAVAACEAIGTRGLVRVDFRVEATDRMWVLEANTVPGLTGHSLAPMAAKAVGADLAQLGEWMVDDCLEMEAVR